MKQFFPAKGAIYCVAIATVIFSHVKITCYFHVWRYHVFVRKLIWYFIGVYIINNDIIAKELINSELTRTNLTRGQGRILTQGPLGCNCIFVTTCLCGLTINSHLIKLAHFYSQVGNKIQIFNFTDVGDSAFLRLALLLSSFATSSCFGFHL